MTTTPATVAFERARPLLGGRLLVASDFDGTLSRLAMDPWRAGIIPGAQRALRQLAALPDTHVAFISGRTVADLTTRVRVGGASYFGDHGAEWADVPRGFRPAAVRSRHEPVDPAAMAMADRLKAEVPAHIGEDWLVVEDKGSAVTFHFRSAPNTDEARRRVRAAVDEIDAEGVLDQPGGRRAWELRPPGATTKGVALAGLIERQRPDTVLMFGDDRHDALALNTVREARAAGRVQGLAVAVISPAGDPVEMARRADLVFGGPDDTVRFLGLLARERAHTRSRQP